MQSTQRAQNTHRTHSALAITSLCLLCAAWMMSGCDPIEDLNAQNSNLHGAVDTNGDGIPDARPDGQGGPDAARVEGGQHPCDPILRALDQASGEEDVVRVLNSYDACLAAHQGPMPPRDGDPSGPDGQGGPRGQGCAMSSEQAAQCEAILAPLYEGQDVLPEDAERLRGEFEACITQTADGDDCSPPPPRGEGECRDIPSDPAACQPITDALSRATDPAEVEHLTAALGRCTEEASRPRVSCPPPPSCRDIAPGGDPTACEPLREALDQAQTPDAREARRADFEACMQQQIGGVMCDPSDPSDPSDSCYEVPEDPSACEAILAPLREGQALPPEEAEPLFEAFDACMQSQPLVTICDDAQGPPPVRGDAPPPPPADRP